MTDKLSDDAVEFPITNELDLHTFHPSETKSVVEEYIHECHRRSITRVRIIHGKGQSVQKFIVRKVLKSHPLVTDHFDAPPESGGWGATIVYVKETA